MPPKVTAPVEAASWMDSVSPASASVTDAKSIVPAPAMVAAEPVRTVVPRFMAVPLVRIVPNRFVVDALRVSRPPTKVVRSPASFPSVITPLLRKVVSFVTVPPPFSVTLYAPLKVSSARTLRSPAIVTVPVDVLDWIARRCAAPATEATSSVALPLSRSVSAVSVTAPSVMAVSVVAISPAVLVPAVTAVASRPPTKRSASPASSPKVRTPALAKDVAVVTVPPPSRDTA